MTIDLSSTLMQASFPVIIGLLTFIAKKAAATLSLIRELNINMNFWVEYVKDHEQRLRVVEHNKRRQGDDLWQQ